MELEDLYPDEAAEAAAVDDELTRLRMGILDAEHRLRLLADRTADYGPEGMRTRLVAEYQKLAHLAWTPDRA